MVIGIPAGVLWIYDQTLHVTQMRMGSPFESGTSQAKPRSKYTRPRNNLIEVKTEKCQINKHQKVLKFGLLNIRSLAPKALIINEMITENNLDALCLTETWIKPGDYMGLNESTPSGYDYKHEPRQTGRGGGVGTIYTASLNVSQMLGFSFKSFEVLVEL
ncbi:hypothetical protein HF521_000618 [Silurus meridionalis]|uniref:Uncharacterized protein n=1 Tax=Silurus meridionalis TaxID=175797 RepID=A0A8T0C0C3_SILME|nr:hypothetical protein HF521_000618 [Silurus meridionalis]